MASFDDLPPCQDLTDQVKKLERGSIASGGFSDVYIGEWTNPAGSKLKVAIKALRVSRITGEAERLNKLNSRLRRESKLWHQLDHPNVLTFLGLVSSPSYGLIPALISPYCGRGSVLDFIKKDPSVERLPIIIGIAKGLQYLHSQDVVHGDLKAQNVLMSDSGTPLLSDFGRSKFIATRGYTTVFTGTGRYLAPEILSCGMSDREDSDATVTPLKSSSPTDSPDESPPISPSEPSTTKQTDVYAFALIGVEVLSGAPVFPKMKGRDFEVFQYVRNGGRPKMEHYKNDGVLSLCSEAGPVWPLMEKCWAMDPEQRPDMDAVVASLGSLNTRFHLRT